MEKTPNNLLTLLESVILMQMLVENLEQLQRSDYNKQLVKQQLKKTISIIAPIVERDYKIVFNNGQDDVQSIIREYEKLVSFISLQKLPQKVVLSQMVEAFNHDPHTIEATTHRIIKKHNKTNQ